MTVAGQMGKPKTRGFDMDTIVTTSGRVCGCTLPLINPRSCESCPNMYKDVLPPPPDYKPVIPSWTCKQCGRELNPCILYCPFCHRSEAVDPAEKAHTWQELHKDEALDSWATQVAGRILAGAASEAGPEPRTQAGPEPRTQEGEGGGEGAG